MARFHDEQSLVLGHIEDMRDVTDGTTAAVVQLSLSTLVLCVLIACRHDKYKTIAALDAALKTAQDEVRRGEIATMLIQ